MDKKEIKQRFEELLGERIKDHVFDRFLEGVKGTNFDDKVIRSYLGKIRAENIKDEYETVKYYHFLLIENFTRLISDIDKHVVYDLTDMFIHLYPFQVFYNIELNANFINYLESFAGLRTCIMEFKKSFRDEQFEVEYQNLINSLPITNGILSKIRNIYHHARGFRLGEITFYTGTSKTNVFGIPVEELLQKTDEWNAEEKKYFASHAVNGYIDIKKLITEHFKEYSSFLFKYGGLLTALVRRKTGHEIHMYI